MLARSESTPWPRPGPERALSGRRSSSISWSPRGSPRARRHRDLMPHVLDLLAGHTEHYSGEPRPGARLAGHHEDQPEFVVARGPRTRSGPTSDIPRWPAASRRRVDGQNDDGSFEGKLSAKLGPMTAAFEGTATVTPDPGTRSARIEGRASTERAGPAGRSSWITGSKPTEPALGDG